MKVIKYLFTFMMVFACLGLCACGGKNTTTENTTETTTTGNNVFPTSVDVSKVNFVNPGKLTVVVSTDFAPMEFVDLTKTGQDKYVGADIEFAKVLAQAFGVELYIKSMSNVIENADEMIREKLLSLHTNIMLELPGFNPVTLSIPDLKCSFAS